MSLSYILYNNPFAHVRFVASYSKINSTNPNKVLAILKQKYTKLEQEIDTHPCKKYRFCNLDYNPENDVYYINDGLTQLSQEETKPMADYISKALDFDTLDYNMERLKKAPVKSLPIIYAILVPVIDALDSIYWRTRPLVCLLRSVDWRHFYRPKNR